MGQVINDFGGFDKSDNLDLWKVWVKEVPSHVIFVLAGSWIEARQCAQTIFHYSYDAFDALILETHTTIIPAGNIVAFCKRDNGKPTGIFEKFRTKTSIIAKDIRAEHLVAM